MPSGSNMATRVGEPIILHIYDMSPMNKWLLYCGVGIFHSGIEVYGAEYAYGGKYFHILGVYIFYNMFLKVS